MDKLDFSKPELLQTVESQEWGYYGSGHGEQFPHCGWFLKDRQRVVVRWDDYGVSNYSVGTCLVAKPQRVKGWVNVYRPSRPGFAVGDLVHKTIADAQNVALSTCIGQIYIDAEVQS